MTGPQATAVRGGRVLQPATGEAPPADILIEAGRIVSIGPPGLTAPADATVVDAAGMLVMPGLVNGHTHGHGPLAKGLVGDRWSLELLLNGGPGMSGSRTAEDKYLSTLLGAAELIRKGCTAAFDLHLELPGPSPEGLAAVVQAYADIGLRAVVAPMLADATLYQAYPGLLDALPAPARDRLGAVRMPAGEESLAVCRQVFADWPATGGLVRPAIAPTIPLHCSDAFMAGCHALASKAGMPLQTHLAESRAQSLVGRDRYGMSLVSHLDRLGLIDERFSAAHAIWIDDDDIARLAERGATVVHNPSSNLRLGSGIARVRQMCAAGLTVGIGTDSSVTSDGQNMFEATRLAAYLSRREADLPDSWLDAPQVFAMATAGSARALGLADRIGRIAPGFCADLVFVALDTVDYVPLRAPLQQVAYVETGANVARVMIDGQVVYEHGRFTRIDLDDLFARANEAAARLDRLNADRRAEARAIEPLVAAFCVGYRARF